MVEVYSWYLDDGPQHINYNYRNKKLLWSGSDNEKAFIQHCKDTDNYKKLKELNWLEPGIITYEYNNHGFRADSFDNQPAGLALGCSFTEGVGVKIEQAWPNVLSKLCGFHIWNLGVGGTSIDTVFRLLDYYLIKFNPKFVCILPPPPARFEYCDIDGNFRCITTFTNYQMEFSKTWLTQDINAKINIRKNLLAIQQICGAMNLPLLIGNIPSCEYCDYLGRDLSHPGIDAHIRLAEHFYTKIKLANINFSAP